MSYFKSLTLPTLLVLASSPVLSKSSLPTLSSLFKHFSQAQQNQHPSHQLSKKNALIQAGDTYADFSGTWTLIPDIGNDPRCPDLLQNAQLIITNTAEFVDFSDQFQSIYSTSIGPVFSYSMINPDGTSDSTVQYATWNAGYTTMHLHLINTNRPAASNDPTEDTNVYDIHLSLSGAHLVMTYQTMAVSIEDLSTSGSTSFQCEFQQ